MSASRVVVAVVILLCAAIGYWLYQLEWVTEEVDLGPKGEARSNQYLAAQRFLRELKVEVTARTADGVFLALPSTSHVLLYEGDRNWLSQKARNRLIAWVNDGGHLIVDTGQPDYWYGDSPVVEMPESEIPADTSEEESVPQLRKRREGEELSDEDDGPSVGDETSLGDELDVSVSKSSAYSGTPPNDPNKAYELRYEDRLAKARSEGKGAMKLLSRLEGEAVVDDLFDLGIYVRRQIGILGNCDNHLWQEDDPYASHCDVALAKLEGIDSNTTIAFNHLDRLFVESPNSRLVAADEGGGLIAQARQGQGMITVVTGLDLFQNHSIGWRDNAHLLYSLIQQKGGRGIWFLSGWVQPSLLDLFWRHGLPVLITAALLLVIWIFRQSLRFGPWIGRSQNSLRSHVEHLRAAAEFFWQRKDTSTLLEGLRELVRSRAQTRFGRVDAVLVLAESAKVSTADANFAMTGKPRRESDLIEITRILQRLLSG